MNLWKFHNQVNIGSLRLPSTTGQFIKEKNNQSYHQNLLAQSLACAASFGGNENMYWNKIFKAICILFVLLSQELNSVCTLTLQGLSYE